MYDGIVQLTINVHDKEMKEAVWAALTLLVDTTTSPTEKFRLSKDDMTLTCQESEDFLVVRNRFPTN